MAEDHLLIETDSDEETIAAGERLGGILRVGDIVALYGDLGAGKTTFVKGVARALNIGEREIASASFIIISEHSGIMPLYHIDLYRISDDNDIINLGVEEYLGADGIAVVEWAERLKGWEWTFSVNLSYSGDSGRLITVKGRPERMAPLRIQE